MNAEVINYIGNAIWLRVKDGKSDALVSFSKTVFTPQH